VFPTHGNLTFGHRIDAVFHDKQLEGTVFVSFPRVLAYLPTPALAAVGVGVHHAGLNQEDRKTIETLFINKVLRVIVATSVSTWCSVPYPGRS
jgi:superfamily II RNA helicase